MTTTYKGSCSCSTLKIEVEGDPSLVGLCHCHNCQKSSSSTYSTNWVVPGPKFKLVSGEPKTYEVTGGSGKKVLRKFCGTCGSLMWNEPAVMSFDIKIVKAGVMDDDVVHKFPPSRESFTCRRPDWVRPIEDAMQLEKGMQ